MRFPDSQGMACNTPRGVVVGSILIFVQKADFLHNQKNQGKWLNMSIVKSLSVGDGDMFYIRHGSDNFTIIDSCMSEDDRKRIVKELKSQSADKRVVRFISTHPDDDHILGLAYLHESMDLLNFYCVKNEATKLDETDDFNQY